MKQISRQNDRLSTLEDYVKEATTTRNLVISDANRELKLVSAVSSTLTIPAVASVAFVPDKMRIALRNVGAGTWTLTAGTGVTLNGVSGGSCTIAPYAACLLSIDDNDDWSVVGGNSSVA